MRLDLNQTISGQPLKLVRNFFRRYRDFHWSVELICDHFGVDEAKGKSIAAAFQKLGLVVKDRTKPNWWFSTQKGARLAIATAAQPIHRTTAERLLQDVLRRIQQANANPGFVYKINTAVVFGSYLSSKDRLGDVDIAVELAPKEEDSKRHWKRHEARIREAVVLGRRFSNIVDQLHWPQLEVPRFLKSRSRGLSIHEMWELEKLNVKYMVVFQCFWKQRTGFS